jgi:hypothetical protein
MKPKQALGFYFPMDEENAGIESFQRGVASRFDHDRVDSSIC